MMPTFGVINLKLFVCATNRAVPCFELSDSEQTLYQA